jgi:hypothetical protein
VRIGLIVDGEAEVRSLKIPVDRARIPELCIIGPVLTRMTPLAPPATFAAECAKNIRILDSRGVDQIVVVLDRENRTAACGFLAEEYARHLRPLSRTPVAVVLKNRMYENWLIADLDALRAQPARFSATPAIARKVAPNRSDHIDALRLLKQITKGPEYSKTQDAKRIMERADPLGIAANSRSFRRLLRVLAHPKYAEQSLNP